MILWFAQLVGWFLAYIVSTLPFTDAARALAEGVFSLTSVSGYSLARSLAMYGVYLAGAGLGAFILLRWRPKLIPEDKSNFQLVIPQITRREWLVLAATVIFFAVAVVASRERVFDTATLESEEFYNLAAGRELAEPNFDLIYPYSAGHLYSLALFERVGISITAYKIFLNTLALVLLYGGISAFIKRPRYRWLAFLGTIIFFIQPLISPSLHRNLLRFLLPALGIMAAYYLATRVYRRPARKIIALAILTIFILWFGSADTLVIFGVTYGLLIALLAWRERDFFSNWGLVAAPVIALLILGGLTGGAYFNLLKNQLAGIVVYSGYANTTPYLSLIDFISSPTGTEMLKNAVYTFIYYIPLLVIGSLVILVVYLGRASTARAANYSLLILLTVTYILIFRQNFGDAGVGRIGIASAVLVFIFPLLYTFDRSKIIQHTKIMMVAFFIAISAISLYFFRYSALELVARRGLPTTNTRLVSCRDTFASQQLAFAGYEFCDPSLIQELFELKSQATGTVYVYDDSFSLYYLLDKRPVVLIPAYYQALERQQQLVRKLEDYQVDHMIVPRAPHFFGVPEPYERDERFLRLINNYKDERFTMVKNLPRYQIFDRQAKKDVILRIHLLPLEAS